MSFVDALNTRITTALNESWNWFSGLSQQEWFVLLGAGAAFGFLCMRGYSSRGHI